MTRDSDHLRDLLRLARVRPRDENGTTLVRLRGFSVVMAFVSTLVVSVVLAAFAYPITPVVFGSRPIPTVLVAAVAVAVVALAAALAVRRHRRIRAGYDDLMIDDQAAAISLPLNFGRSTPTTIPIEQISEVAFAEELPKRADLLDAHSFGKKCYRKLAAVADDELPKVGHRDEMQYAVVVCWSPADGTEIVEPIVRWSERRRANAFASWLNARLGLPVRERTSIDGDQPPHRTPQPAR